MLKESGVVIQEPEGARRAVSPEEAKEYLSHAPGTEKTLRIGFRGIT